MRKHEIEHARGSIREKVEGDVNQAELVFCDSAASSQRQQEPIMQLWAWNKTKQSLWVRLRRCHNLRAGPQRAAAQPGPLR